MHSVSLHIIQNAHRWRHFPTVACAWDRAQAAEVRDEAEDQRLTALRLRLKNVQRRAARHLAQIELGQRLRTAGVEYEPELEQLAVTQDDGTHPDHYAFQLHGLLFACGPLQSLVVFTPDEETRSFKVWDIGVWDIGALGRAVQALGGLR